MDLNTGVEPNLVRVWAGVRRVSRRDPDLRRCFNPLLTAQYAVLRRVCFTCWTSRPSRRIRWAPGRTPTVIPRAAVAGLQSEERSRHGRRYD